MGKDADIYMQELEELLSLQESYFDTLLKKGIFLENYGKRQEAFDVYKAGLIKAEKAQQVLSGSMLGLLD